VERAVARDYTLSWDPPLNDNFVSPVKVGVLPPLVARPDVRLHPPFDLTVGSDEKPIPFHGSRFHLSWDPYPGATGYRVRIQNVRGGTLPLPSNPLFSQVGPGERVLKLDLLLAGMHSIFNRSHVYELAVVAMQGDVEVSTSRVVCIQPMDALAPILLTTASLNKVLAPDYRVTSVASRGGGFVVTGTCAVDDYDEIWDRLSVLPGIYPGDSEFHPDASNPSRGTFTLSVSTAGEQ
jgi:hypothetical protein